MAQEEVSQSDIDAIYRKREVKALHEWFKEIKEQSG